MTVARMNLSHLCGMELQHSDTDTRTPAERLSEKAERFNRRIGDLTDYDCPICHNKGVVMWIDGNTERFRECECISVRRSAKLIRQSGLSQTIANKTFDSFETADRWREVAKEAAQSYVKDAVDNNMWMLMCGQSGAGKTHLCTATAGELLRKGVPVLYMLWRSEVVRLKANALNTEYENILRPFKEVRCLYIDDMFKGKVTDSDLNIAFELLDHRYRQQLPTIISMEKSLKDLEMLDEAIAGRIMEMCGGKYVVWISNDKSKNYRLR